MRKRRPREVRDLIKTLLLRARPDLVASQKRGFRFPQSRATVPSYPKLERPRPAPGRLREVSAREGLCQRTRWPGGREGPGGRRPGGRKLPGAQPRAPGAQAVESAQVAAALRSVRHGPARIRLRGAGGGRGGAARAAVQCPQRRAGGAVPACPQRPGRGPGSWVAAPLAWPG